MLDEVEEIDTEEDVEDNEDSKNNHLVQHLRNFVEEATAL